VQEPFFPAEEIEDFPQGHFHFLSFALTRKAKEIRASTPVIDSYAFCLAQRKPKSFTPAHA